tara:strand:- start:2509 stop:2766 length:258 start_codon:yes stop_codon:yes gene_type:complete
MEKVFNQEETAKLTHLINSGIQVKQEVADLNSGLRDTIKAIAEEMDLKPSLLSKAVNVAYKESLSAERQEFEDLEHILATVKKDS